MYVFRGLESGIIVLVLAVTAKLMLKKEAIGTVWRPVRPHNVIPLANI